MENRNIYKGHRYVPKIMGEWNNQEQYEGLCIVTHEGTSYTSKKHVPVGVDILNTEYWVVTGNYNAQVEHYRQDVRDMQDEVNSTSQQLTQTIQQLEETRQHEMSYINASKPPYNIRGDGEQNATNRINNAINDVYEAGGGTVYIPYSPEPYMINAVTSINLKSGVNLKIDDGVVFKALPNANMNYRVIRALDVRDINVTGRFKIIGERYEHTGTTGEWGNGVEIKGCTNIYFEYINSSQCWGDGVLISGNKEAQMYSENIRVDEMYCDDNRRQGLTIGSVKGVYIGHAELTNTHGTSPECGLDFEPDINTSFIQGFYIENLITKGNAQSGVLFYFGTLMNSENYVDITIENFHSFEDYIGVTFRGGGNIDGTIRFNNQPIIEKSDHYAIFHINYPSTNPRVVFDKPIIIDPLEKQTSTSDEYATAVAVRRNPTDIAGAEGEYIGNIELIEPSVIEIREEKKVQSAIHIRNFHEEKVDKISIIDPRRLDGLRRKLLSYAEDIVLSDKYSVLIKKMDDEDISVSSNDLHVSYTTEGNTAPRTLSLGGSLVIGTEIDVVIANNNKLTIETGNRIHPIETSFNKKISSSQEGARIKIRKVRTNAWRIISMVGEWVEEDA